MGDDSEAIGWFKRALQWTNQKHVSAGLNLNKISKNIPKKSPLMERQEAEIPVYENKSLKFEYHKITKLIS